MRCGFVLFISVDCPDGDTAGVIKNGQTCTQLILDTNFECYDNATVTSCCQSCNNIERSDIGKCFKGKLHDSIFCDQEWEVLYSVDTGHQF